MFDKYNAKLYTAGVVDTTRHSLYIPIFTFVCLLLLVIVSIFQTADIGTINVSFLGMDNSRGGVDMRGVVGGNGGGGLWTGQCIGYCDSSFLV